MPDTIDTAGDHQLGLKLLTLSLIAVRPSRYNINIKLNKIIKI